MRRQRPILGPSPYQAGRRYCGYSLLSGGRGLSRRPGVKPGRVAVESTCYSLGLPSCHCSRALHCIPPIRARPLGGPRYEESRSLRNLRRRSTWCRAHVTHPALPLFWPRLVLLWMEARPGAIHCPPSQMLGFCKRSAVHAAKGPAGTGKARGIYTIHAQRTLDMFKDLFDWIWHGEDLARAEIYDGCKARVGSSLPHRAGRSKTGARRWS